MLYGACCEARSRFEFNPEWEPRYESANRLAAKIDIITGPDSGILAGG